MQQNDEKLDVCIPNPFSGVKNIEEINGAPDKQIALTTIVQFVHHYARHIL